MWREKDVVRGVLLRFVLEGVLGIFRVEVVVVVWEKMEVRLERVLVRLDWVKVGL